MIIYSEKNDSLCGSFKLGTDVFPNPVLNVSETAPALGRVEKWKNNILKYADVDYYGNIYIKQGSIEKNRIFNILAGCFFILKF